MSSIAAEDHHADSSDPRLAPILAMANFLPPHAVEEVARALHARLNAPPTPAQRRVGELGFLARLLDERPQHPERLPYIARQIYDVRRLVDAPDAPPSARLQERYGSWARACHAAWGLLGDGRWFAGGQPWPRPPRGRPYTVEEAEASVRECADALGRIPSSYEYLMWAINRRQRARAAGGVCRVAHLSTVLRLLAPERSDRNGWKLVRARVFPTNA